MPEKFPVILDGDPGHDDAIAWMLAASSPRLDIRAVTSVCGNQTIEKTTYNALRVCTLLGLSCPVGKGRPAPLLSAPMNAPSVHGESGLDGPALPEPHMQPCALRAPELMAKVLRESETPVVIVATGPLTNVATALAKYPQLTSLLARIVLMGGAAVGGNRTPCAEYNIFADPDAAQAVFRSGVSLVMCGLDVTHQAYLTPAELDALCEKGTAVTRFVRAATAGALRFNMSAGLGGLCLHDVCPLLYLAQPELFGGEMAGVFVETRGALTRGKTVTDLYSDHQFDTKNALVLLTLDRARFVEQVVRTLHAY